MGNCAARLLVLELEERWRAAADVLQLLHADYDGVAVQPRDDGADACHLRLTTCHLPLATYYSLLATCYLLLATCHSLPSAYYLLLPTHYLLLTPHLRRRMGARGGIGRIKGSAVFNSILATAPRPSNHIAIT